METFDCIKTRKSCRKFNGDKVDSGIIKSVLENARRAPSYKNSQPWRVAVVSGEKALELSSLLLGLLESRVEVSPDIPEPAPWPEAIDSRIKETARARAQAFGIVPGPGSVRQSKEANFRFYGARTVLFFYQEDSLGDWSLLDLGMFIQNVILGFHDKGVATVPQAFLIDYSPQIKKYLGIEERMKLVLGMSIGYPDTNDIRSQFESPREDLEKLVTWVE